MILYGLINSCYFIFIYRDVIKYLIIEEKVVDFTLISFVVLFIFTILIMMGLFIFNIFHFWITIKNFTTYEFVTQIVRGKNDGRINRIEQQSRFDISPYENWKQVYGSVCYLILWFLPIKTQKENIWNNGINFKVNMKFEYEIIKSV